MRYFSRYLGTYRNTEIHTYIQKVSFYNIEDNGLLRYAPICWRVRDSRINLQRYSCFRQLFTPPPGDRAGGQGYIVGMADLGSKWVGLAPNGAIGTKPGLVHIRFLTWPEKKIRLCPIWGQSNPLWAQFWHPCYRVDARWGQDILDCSSCTAL